GKIPVKALIDTTSKSNTISNRLYNKLEEDYGLEGISGDDLIGKEIKCLDLQFRYKGKWRSLDGTEVIDFQIRKNPSFDLVLGRDWLWMREAKISFGFSLENCTRYAKIEIDGMSIPLIEEDSRPTGDSSTHKTSSTKNNSSFAKQWEFVPNSTESKPGLAQEGVMNIINKILSNIEDNVSKNSSTSNKNRVKYSTDFDTSSNSDISDSSDSSLSRLRSEVANMHKTASAKKHPIKRRYQPNQPRQPNYPPSLTDAQKKAVEQPRNEKGQFDKKGTPINHYERYPYQPW
ncbi:16178_t:CDS:2, partial [Entrophospora sp. SA101]